MTKTIKKSLLCFLVFVTALMGIGAIATVPAKADDGSVTPDYMQQFVTLMNEDYGTVTTSIIADNTKRANILAAKVAYEKLSDAEKDNAGVVAAKTKFDSIWTVFVDADEIINYHNSTMFYMTKGDIKYSQKERFDNLMAKYDSSEEIDANEKGWIDAETTNMKYRSTVDTLFIAIATRAGDAKTEISNIIYYKENAMVTGFEEGASVVVRSLDSIKNAMNKLNAIYGDTFKYAELSDATTKFEKKNTTATTTWTAEIAAFGDILNNTGDFDNAITAWNDLIDTVNAVSDEISTLKAKVEDEHSYKGNALAITNAKEKYDALENTDMYISSDPDMKVNNLQGYVDSDFVDMLNAMVDGLKTVNDMINNIKGKITALQTQKTSDSDNGIYTYECKTLLDEIATLFGSITDAVVKSSPSDYIDDWDSYKLDKDDFEKKEDNIKDLKDVLDSLQTDATKIVESFTEGKGGARDLFRAFCPYQKNGQIVGGETRLTGFSSALLHDGVSNVVKNDDFGKMDVPVANYGELYDALLAKATTVRALASEFDGKVNDLSYVFNATFIAAVNNLITEYVGLNPAVSNAVTTKDKLFGYRTSYLTAANKADVWKASVLGGTVETVTYDGIPDYDKTNNTVDYLKKYLNDYVNVSMLLYADLMSQLGKTDSELAEILNEISDYSSAYSRYAEIVKSMYGVTYTVNTTDRTVTNGIDADADKKGILDRIYDVSVKMSELNPNEIGINNASEITTFKNKTTAAKNAYEGKTATETEPVVVGLAVAEKNYLQKTYESAYNNYVAALVHFDQYSVEASIIAIGSLDSITIAKATVIDDAKTAYDALNDATKAKVRNYASGSQDPNLEDAIVRLSNLTSNYKTWINDVIRLIDSDSDSVDASGFTADNLNAVNLETVISLYVRYYNFIDRTVGEGTYVAVKSDDGAYTGAYTLNGSANNSANNDSNVIGYLEDAKSLLDAIQEKAFTLITGLTTDMSALTIEGGFNISSDFDKLADYQARFVALDDTQKNEIYNLVNGSVEEGVEEITALLAEYEAFSELYANQTFANQFTAAVDQLYKDVVIFANFSKSDEWCWYVSESTYYVLKQLQLTWTSNPDFHEVLLVDYDNPLFGGDYNADPYIPALNDIANVDIVTYGDLLSYIESYLNNENGQYAHGTSFEDYVMGQIDSLDAVINGTIGNFGNRRNDGLIYQVNSLSTDISAAEDAIETINGTLATLATTSKLTTELNALKSQLEESIADNTAAIDVLKERISTAESSISSLTTALNNFKSEVANTYFTIADMDAYKETVTAKFIEMTNYVDGKVSEINTAIEGVKTEINAVKTDLNTYKTETNATLSALNAAIEKEKADRETADNKLAADIAANDKAINELLNSKVAQLNKTITIITVIFSVVMAGMIACTVILFLKKK